MSSDEGGGGEVRPTHPELLVPFVVYLVVIVAMLAVAITVGLGHH